MYTKGYLYVLIIERETKKPIILIIISPILIIPIRLKESHFVTKEIYSAPATPANPEIFHPLADFSRIFQFSDQNVGKIRKIL